MKVLVVIGAIALLPMLALAQQSQLPQRASRANGARKAGARTATIVYRAPTRRGRQFPRTVDVLSDGARVAVIAFAEGPQQRASLHRRHFQVIASRPAARGSPRNDCSPCHPLLAPTNKCLAQRNKSRAGGKATKTRNRHGADIDRVVMRHDATGGQIDRATSRAHPAQGALRRLSRELPRRTRDYGLLHAESRRRRQCRG